MFDQDPNEQITISGADFAIMCDEMNALKQQRDELKRAIHYALGYIEADGEAECMRALQRTGIKGHRIFSDCDCDNSYHGGHEDLDESARSKAMVLKWFRNEAERNADLQTQLDEVSKQRNVLLEHVRNNLGEAFAQNAIYAAMGEKK